MEKVANPTLTQFENALLDALLAGDHPYLAALRSQLRVATPVSREWNPAGEFLNFGVSTDAQLVTPANFELADVFFEMAGVPHGGGSVLFIRKGAIDFLETYSHVGDLPEPGNERNFVLTYFRGTRNLAHLQEELDWRLNGMKPDQMPAHLGPPLRSPS